jgi:cell fate (sporulation/competence/biofilm development) regulator YlbF (YheA/YmcA/DUF963 family)
MAAILDALRGRMRQRESNAIDAIAAGARAAARGESYDVTQIESALIETRQTAADFEAAVDVARQRQTWLKQFEQLAAAASKSDKLEAAIQAEEEKLAEARRAAIGRCDAMRVELAIHASRRDQGKDAREALLRPAGVPGTIGDQWRSAIAARDAAEVQRSETQRQLNESRAKFKSEERWIEQIIGEVDKTIKPNILDRITGQKLYGDQANRVEQHTLALKRAQRRIEEAEAQLAVDEKALTKAQKAVDDLAPQVVRA